MNSTTKAQKFWDKTAPNYDKEEEKDKQTHFLAINKIKTLLKPQDIVLDFACGTGIVSNEISEEVKQIIAIDFSSKMIEQAKAKIDKKNIENIQYRQLSIFDKSLEEGAYDVILAVYVLHLITKPTETLNRIHQLLKPNGLFISVTPCMKEKPIVNLGLSLLSKIGAIPPIEAFKKNELENRIQQNGFDLIKSELLDKTNNQAFIAAIKKPSSYDRRDHSEDFKQEN